MPPVKLSFSWRASFFSSRFNLHGEGVWGRVQQDPAPVGLGGMTEVWGAGAHLSLAWWALLQPCCSSFSRESMSLSTSSSSAAATSGAEPRHMAPCPAPHPAPARGAPNGPQSTQPDARREYVPTLSLQDAGGEAEDEDDEWQGGHRHGPPLQKAPRTWAAPQSPTTRLPGPQSPRAPTHVPRDLSPLPRARRRMRAGCWWLPPPSSQAPPKPPPRQSPSPEAPSSCAGGRVTSRMFAAATDALHISFTVTVVKLQG